MELVFLSPLVYQLTGFGQVSALTMMQHLFSRYGAIDEIDLGENAVKMMGPYDPAEPPCQTDLTVGKGQRFFNSRSPDNLERHDDFKRNHPSSTNGGFQRQHPRVETTIFPTSRSGSKKSGNNRRNRGVHCDSAKYLRCTTSSSRRALLSYRIHSNNHAGNGNTRLRAGSTGTS